jgi:hypothetical protein
VRLLRRVRDARTLSTLLRAAERHAHDLGDAPPGTEHLLLAALDLPDGSARRAFARVGADPDGLRAAVVRGHDDALRAIGLEPPDEASLGADRPARPRLYRATPAVTLAVHATAPLAKADGGLQSAHVVVTVAEQEHGTAARALRAMGVDRLALAAAARAEAAEATR